MASAADVRTLVPTDDTFVWDAHPASNYGAAGALSVSGPTAVNANGDPQGQYQTLMKFDVSALAAEMDGIYGPNSWAIASAQLAVTENAEDIGSTRFNLGLGEFEVFWLSDDTWKEGTGTPRDHYEPPPGSNEVTWNLLQIILGSATEASLGVFGNEMTNGRRTYDLTLTPSFGQDVQAGDALSLRLVHVSSNIGFVLDSRKNEDPELILTVIPEPSSVGLFVVGLLVCRRACRPRRRAH